MKYTMQFDGWIRGAMAVAALGAVTTTGAIADAQTFDTPEARETTFGTPGRVTNDDFGLAPPSANVFAPRRTTRVEMQRTAAVGSCRYITLVRGTLREAPGRTTWNAATPSYRPDLTTTTEVRCDDGHVARLPTRRIAGSAKRIDQLAHLLTRRGTVDMNVNGRMCHYAPVFNIDRNGQTTLPDVQTTCTTSAPYAIGGGPGAAHRVRHTHR